MKVEFILKKKVFYFFTVLLFFSCSQEEIIDDPTVNQLLLKEDSHITETNTFSSCVSEFFVQPGQGYVDRNFNEKSLTSSAIQTISTFRVEAYYTINREIELPATIIINIDGNEQVYSGIIPGAMVSHSVELPEGWKGGDEIQYSIKQIAYLEPVEINKVYTLQTPCPPELGENSPYGGLVAHIYGPGEEGYVEGESHGIILNTDFYPTLPWVEALDWAENLDDKGYTDWTVPNITDLEKIMTDFPNQFQYDPFQIYGVWSSTEYDLIDYFAYAGNLSTGGVNLPPVFEKVGINKSYGLKVRAVRYF